MPYPSHGVLGTASMLAVGDVHGTHRGGSDDPCKEPGRQNRGEGTMQDRHRCLTRYSTDVEATTRARSPDVHRPLTEHP